MNVKENKITKNIWIVFMFIALFWPLAFINKGIDITDTGYYLANYSHILSTPENFGIGMFLSNYFGGLIYSAIPSHQLIVFKMLNMLTNGISIILAFLTLRKFFSKNSLAFFIMISSFLLAEYPQCLSYNTFSILLLSLSIFLLKNWFDTQKKPFLILSGIIIGFSVFFRLPNILFGGLYIAVLWYDIILDRKKEILKDTFKMFLGGMAGLLAGGGLMLYFIGIPGLLKGFNRYTGVAASTQGSHSMWIIFKRFCLQVLRGTYAHIYFIAVIAVFSVILSFLLYRYKNTEKKTYIKIAIFTISVMCIISMIFNSLKFETIYNQTEMVAVILFPLSIFSALYYRKTDISLSVMSAILLVISAVLPLGTDTGFRIHAAGYFWFLPYTALIFISLAKDYYNAKKLTFLRAIVLSCCIALISNIIGYNIFRSTKVMCTSQYRETYHNLNYSPHNSVLADVYTTEVKCFMIDGVTQFMKDDKYPDKKILVMNMAPIIYALVDNKNVFGTTFWPDLESFSMDKFYSQLSQSVDNNDLPIVIIYNMTGTDTPIEEDSERVSYVRQFCDDNNYITADEGILNGEKIYTILVPQPE